jgi:cyanophycin synthetase
MALWGKQDAATPTGTSIDVTDMMHPENIFMAERISRIIGLASCRIALQRQ